MIGIIGTIGAGKSTVARILEEKGAAIIVADRIGHEILEQSEFKQKIVDAFGKGILKHDGSTIDRSQLGAIVFRSQADRTRLEAIVHPPIGRELRRRVGQAMTDQNATAVVLDAAVLLEAGWNDVCTHVIMVDAPHETRYKRVFASRGWSKEELDRRENAQWSAEKKRKYADLVIDNDGDLESVRNSLLSWFDALVDNPNGQENNSAEN